MRHADAVDIHKGAYFQSDDPGAVGPGILWVDSTGGSPPYPFKVRNAANDGWEDVVLPGTSTGVLTVNVVLNGAESAIATGIKTDVFLEFGATITAATLLAEPAGEDVVVDLWVAPYADWPPTVADSICSTHKPTLSSGVHSLRDTTLTGWTPDLAQGDILRVNLEANSGATRVTLALTLERA